MLGPTLARTAMRLLCIAAAGFPGGCAYVTAVPVTPGSTVSGIRIYDVKPLLVVNGEQAQVQIVPNYNRAYALQFGAFLAKNDFQAKFTNGIISEVHADMDTTEMIKFLTDILKTVNGQALSGEAQPGPNGGIKDRFQVFDFVFDEAGNLVALRPLINQQDLLHVRTSSVAGVVPPPIIVEQPGGGAVVPGPIPGRSPG